MLQSPETELRRGTGSRAQSCSQVANRRFSDFDVDCVRTQHVSAPQRSSNGYCRTDDIIARHKVGLSDLYQSWLTLIGGTRTLFGDPLLFMTNRCHAVMGHSGTDHAAQGPRGALAHRIQNITPARSPPLGQTWRPDDPSAAASAYRSRQPRIAAGSLCTARKQFLDKATRPATVVLILAQIARQHRQFGRNPVFRIETV